MVQSLAADLGIETPYIVVVGAQKEVLKVDKTPDEVVGVSWEDYRALVPKIRRGSTNPTTFFYVDKDELQISTIRMGMRGSGIKRTFKVQDDNGRYLFTLTGSMIMA
ncbi:MAG TPA: hypothetical protein VM821_06950 [Abditibacteriaceae bacterium]|jgi:hypothetical protein|nr:hypothetical protein [Abditibacteriaceae bacterium]